MIGLVCVEIGLICEGEEGLGDSDVFVPGSDCGMTDKRVDWERTI